VALKWRSQIVDPWLHIINDEEAEKKWAFSLARTLRAAAKSPLLAGYKVHATKSVVPPPAQLKGKYSFSAHEAADEFFI
jgi:hypothetical protein